MGRAKGHRGVMKERDTEYFTLDYHSKCPIHTSAASFLSSFWREPHLAVFPCFVSPSRIPPCAERSVSSGEGPFSLPAPAHFSMQALVTRVEEILWLLYPGAPRWTEAVRICGGRDGGRDRGVDKSSIIAEKLWNPQSSLCRSEK